MIDLTSLKQVVEVLILLGLLEGEDALNYDEQNDSSGENINLTTIISFALLDFWCHVGHCASVGPESINFFVGSEAEISNLQVQILINEDVFELEITMNNIL